MSPDPILSRRDLLSLTGAAAALGSLAQFERLVALFAGPSLGAQTTSKLAFPRGAIVRTAVADIDPNTIVGATLMHEHLGNGRAPSRNAAPAAGNAPAAAPSEDPEWMAEELVAARNAGVGCIVAAQTSLPSADVMRYLQQLSAKTGLRLVNAGGYYTKQTYPADLATLSDDQIAARLVEASVAGRFGAFGEIGVANGEADLDPVERKVFRAVGKAHLKTGLPIFTHNNYSTGPAVPMDIALRQLDAFESVGVPPQHVAIGHVCCLDDPKVETARALAKRGAFVAFDRVTRQQQWVSDEHRLTMILAFLEAGYVDRLLLSSDYIGRINTSVGEVSFYPGPLHARDGGPGYARPLLLFVPRMKKAGVSDAMIRTITADNPRRWLAFVPRRV